MSVPAGVERLKGPTWVVEVLNDIVVGVRARRTIGRIE